MAVADDATLIRRWQRGDAAALAALVERWQTPVARFLARLAGRDRAADLCQETFLRLIRSPHGYREQGTFSTWLFQVALNVARDAARRPIQFGSPRPDSARGARSLADPPDALLERDELNRAVADAVSELPVPLREVLALRHDAGLNFEAMARTTGTPASTLKSRFAAALTRLREQLAHLGYQTEETLP